MSKKDALQAIADEYGYDDIMDAIEEEGWAIDSIVPGACTQCSAVRDSVEPDARDYECEEGCGRTLHSVLVLLDVI